MMASIFFTERLPAFRNSKTATCGRPSQGLFGRTGFDPADCSARAPALAVHGQLARNTTKRLHKSRVYANSFAGPIWKHRQIFVPRFAGPIPASGRMPEITE